MSEITPADDAIEVTPARINWYILENSIVLEFSDCELMQSYLDDISTYHSRVRKTNSTGYNFSLETFWEFIGYLKGRQIPEKQSTTHLKELLKYKNNVQHVVGYVEGDIMTKRHQLRHAKYHTNIVYRSYVYELWDRMAEAEKHKIVEHFRSLHGLKHMDDIVDAFQASYYTYGPRFGGFYVEGAFM